MITLRPILNFRNHTVASSPGVYIWGFALPKQEQINELTASLENMSIDQVVNFNINDVENTAVADDEIFCPLNVGMSDALISDRICDHYTRESFDKTVMFDLRLNPPCIYAGVKAYNQHWILMGDARSMATLHELVNLNVNPNASSLLFFSNPRFYSQVFPDIHLPADFLVRKNVSQNQVMTTLPNVLSNVAELKRKLLFSRIILKRYFRFTYVPIEPTLFDLNNYEAAIKWSLEQMDLYTIAHLHGNGRKVYGNLRIGQIPLNDTIDFDTNLLGKIYNPRSLSTLDFNI
jgi:hypothetical protein